MKAHERLRRMRETKSFSVRHQLARDALPGTKFDALFADLIGALPYAKAENKERYTDKGFDIEGMARDTIFAFGLHLVKAIKAKDPQLFFALGDAVTGLRHYKPNPDRVRLALIEFYVPPNKARSLREVIQYLTSENAVKSEDAESRKILERVIRQKCDELGFKIKGEPGRPKA